MNHLSKALLLAGILWGISTNTFGQAVPTKIVSPVDITSPRAALTPTVMTKMLQLITLFGHDHEIPGSVAKALGLSTGQVWQDRQVSAHATHDTYMHGFAVSRGDDQEIVVYGRDSDTLYNFRAHRDGTIVSAIIFDKNTRKITMRDPAEAQNDLNTELQFWADSVDKLLSSGK